MAAHRATGRLLAARGEAAGGLEHALRAVAMSDALYQVEPDNSEWLQANAGARHDLADLQLSTGRASEAAATIRAGCAITERLVKLDPAVNYWSGPLWTRCLLQRARLALQQRAPAEAMALSRQALLAAGRQARPLDKRILSLAALAIESDSHAAAGRRRAAVEAAERAIRAAPAPGLLNPRELAEVGVMQLRTGNRAAADHAYKRLDAIGYRHPAYLRSRTAPAADKKESRI
jgi:tetratricopeptide (TPR) repeat protein